MTPKPLPPKYPVVGNTDTSNVGQWMEWGDQFCDIAINGCCLCLSTILLSLYIQLSIYIYIMQLYIYINFIISRFCGVYNWHVMARKTNNNSQFSGLQGKYSSGMASQYWEAF